MYMKGTAETSLEINLLSRYEMKKVKNSVTDQIDFYIIFNECWMVHPARSTAMQNHALAWARYYAIKHAPYNTIMMNPLWNCDYKILYLIQQIDEKSQCFEIVDFVWKSPKDEKK